MIFSMFLAHLVGDYILQWDQLAYWKSQEVKGVAAHCLVVAIVTALFAWPFQVPYWWQGVLYIIVTHFLIDVANLKIAQSGWPIHPLMRYVGDQVLHFVTIFTALVIGGFIELGGVTAVIQTLSQDQNMLLYLMGYAFVTMPAWVLIKFLAYGLVKGTGPVFPDTGKYVGIIERVLITTLAVIGQFLLIPLVAMPRLVIEWHKLTDQDSNVVYVVELLASIAISITIGIALSQLS